MMELVQKDSEETPSLNKKSKVQVLDEDTYEQSLDKIIQRDFFPELNKIRAQNEYLDATEDNDVQRLRDISERFQTSTRRIDTPTTFETPRTVPGTPLHDETKKQQSSSIDNAPTGEEKTNPSDVSLDTFLAKHTSEDNASFEQIMEHARLRQREKYAWLYKKEDEQLQNSQLSITMPKSQEGDQLLQEDRPAMVETWKYQNKNALMYCPEGMEASMKEMIENKRQPQEVVHNNTRFVKNPFPDDAFTESLASAAASKSANQAGRFGVDGNEQNAGSSPKVGGFGFVAATPSLEPGVDASPLMTWGTIDGTPFRLDGSDMSKPVTPGPVFRMPEPKRREQLGLALAEKVSKKKREKTREARAQAAAMIGKSPSHVNTIERLNSMSPAAKRLASTRLGIKMATDKALQSSYSPSHGLTSPHTPRTATPKHTTPIRDISMTDDLLKLPKR